MKKIRLAVLCSGKGRGTNFQALVEYFDQHPFVELTLLIASRKQSGAWEKAQVRNIATERISPLSSHFNQQLLTVLQQYQIDIIALAGFMSKIPESILAAYPRKIVNIHPALLPHYGGPGMFGHHVHAKVHQNRETESGATVHLVDEEYDHGEIIAQEKVSIPPDATPHEIGQLVLQIEHRLYGPTLEKYIRAVFAIHE